ncbi:hypothetical protein, partial [Xenorhabdus griffiniae]|uniref:hypothetical protein n=1 Tax=Xenorhabdus griffiniae TaxID=351672 RepID=UPI001CB95033
WVLFEHSSLSINWNHDQKKISEPAKIKGIFFCIAPEIAATQGRLVKFCIAGANESDNQDINACILYLSLIFPLKFPGEI